MSGGLLLTTGHLYIPDGDEPEEVGNEYISMKVLYKQYRGSSSHGVVSVPFFLHSQPFLGREGKDFEGGPDQALLEPDGGKAYCGK